MKEAREKKHTSYMGAIIQMTVYLRETMEARRQ